MNLYRVHDEGAYSEVKYILAKNKADAIKKFIDTAPNMHNGIYCKYICKRDNILTTIEPVEEFKDL